MLVLQAMYTAAMFEQHMQVQYIGMLVSAAACGRKTSHGDASGSAEPMELQLASMRSIRHFVDQIKALRCNIDYLVLNAAIMGCPLW